MALLREVEKLDDVPEAYRPFYKPLGETGKFVNEDIEDVVALKTTIKATRAERDLARTEVKAFKDSGLTPEQIAEVRAKVEELEHAGKAPDIEKLVAKRVAEAKKDLEPVVTERDALKAENRRLKLTDKVRADFIAAKGIEDDADLMLRDTDGRFDLNEKGKIVVLDEEGDPTGQTPQEWFEKVYLKKRPKFFKGTGAAGGGAHQGESGGSGALAEIAKLPPAERVSRLRAMGVKA